MYDTSRYTANTTKRERDIDGARESIITKLKRKGDL